MTPRERDPLLPREPPTRSVVGHAFELNSGFVRSSKDGLSGSDPPSKTRRSPRQPPRLPGRLAYRRLECRTRPSVAPRRVAEIPLAFLTTDPVWCCRSSRATESAEAPDPGYPRRMRGSGATTRNSNAGTAAEGRGPKRRNAAGPDASALEPSDLHARRERPVDRETIERSEINGRDTSATPH